jgi:O-antigen/teichoic acid export membrane protein
MFDNFKNKIPINNGLLTLGSSNLFAYAIFGLFWFFLARYLGPDEYGEVSYFYAIGIVIIAVSTVGLQTGIVVFSSKEPKTVNSFLTLGLILSIIASTISFILFSHIEVSLLVIGTSFFGLYTYSILGKKKYPKFSLLTILQKPSSIALALVFYYLIGLEGIILGIAIGYLLFSKGIYDLILKRNFDLSQIKPKIKFISNNYISESTHNLVWWSDRFILLPLYGFSFLGNYQLGMHILQMTSVMPFIFYQYLLPNDSTGTTTNKIRFLCISISVIITILSLIFGPSAIQFLFPNYDLTSNFIQIFSLTLIPLTINLIFSSYYLGNKRTSVIAIGNSILFSTQIILVLIFTSFFDFALIPYAILLAFISQTIFFTLVKLYK